MVDVKLVSAQAGEGQIEPVRMYIADADGCDAVRLVGATDAGGIAEQLRRARRTAMDFLERPCVRPLVRRPLSEGCLVAEFSSGKEYVGGSFGLGFLTGCLSLALDVPLREDRLFTAALAESPSKTSRAGSLCQLSSVSEISAKLSSACIARLAHLYLYCHEERKLIDFEQGYWRDEAGRSCLPVALPPQLSIAACAAACLQAQPLLARCLETPEGTALVLLLLEACGELAGGNCFVEGIGPAVAAVRSRPESTHSESFQSLALERNAAGMDFLEPFLAPAIERCLQMAIPDQYKPELLKAAVSDDPARLPCPTSIEASDASSQTNTDLDQWLETGDITSVTDLRLALIAVTLADDLVPEPALYKPRMRQLIEGGLDKLIDAAARFAGTSRPEVAGKILEQLSRLPLGRCLARFGGASIEQACSSIEQRQRELTSTPQLAQRTRVLYGRLRRHHVPESFAEITSDGANELRLSFGLASRPVQYGDQKLSRPTDFNRSNDLELHISGPNELQLTVPAPILLMESAIRQHGRNLQHCLRAGTTRADDTFSRFPPNDADAIWNLYQESSAPIRIGFRVRSDAEPASVAWSPRLTPWPPAIDSQLLTATMVQHGQESQPQTVLDVGCGTGYLAIAAAHLWPTLQELHLLDIEPTSVAAAALNAREDPVASRLSIASLTMAFAHFRQDNFDAILCAPPYLPERAIPSTGIERATNGTKLLEDVVVRGPSLAREIWMVFSGFAWPEFQRALLASQRRNLRVELLRRNFVPFRIPWLLPSLPPQDWTWQQLAQKRPYVKRLFERGLIDLDNHREWHRYLAERRPSLPTGASAEWVCHPEEEQLEHMLYAIDEDHRGYRFWHEVRVVRLIAE